MARFFLDRPVFAWVIAILIMMIGGLSIVRLPIELYPQVAPPTVMVMVSLPGASAKTMATSVTQVIEQQLSGIDHLRYFMSSSTNGSANVILTFEPGTDPDIAQVQTQNKVQAALPQLPQAVQQNGVQVTKSNNNFLMVAGFSTDDGSISQEALGDMISSQIQDPVSRINGVGSVQVFGEPHAMRIWLNPDKLRSYSLTVIDVLNALKDQNSDVSAGELGGMPAVNGQELNATINARSRLSTVPQFKNIILRVNNDGSQVRLGDVARVQLGSQSYNRIVRYRREPAAALAVSLASGANALEVTEAVKAKIEQLKKQLPSAVTLAYPNDSAPFIRLSIEHVVRTLSEAFVLVLLVMFLFLQNVRATLIPAIAVPIVLLGTFGALSIFGYSVNTLTMFAVVLTIGLLVDDAIVVVENVERLMTEEGLPPMEATRKSMEQISTALIGIAVVLAAVFVPMAFFPGSSGVIYRQFSVTMVSAITLSIFIALVLSPTMCAALLRPQDDKARTRGVFGWFNRGFDEVRDFYRTAAEFMVHHLRRFFVLYGVIVVIVAVLFSGLPSSFLPNEDQGLMLFSITTPPGSTAQRTRQTAKAVENYFMDGPDAKYIKHVLTIVGFSFTGVAQNTAFGFIGLTDWSKRTSKDASVFSIAGRAMKAFGKLPDAKVFAFYPPPIRELGNSAGFQFELVDSGGAGHEALMQAQGQFLNMARKDPLLANVRPNGFSDVPQYNVDIDTQKAEALGLSVSSVDQTLQTAWGSAYVGNFIDKGRIKRVYVQADAPYRMMPKDVGDWYVRNAKGDMVSFNEFSSGNWSYGSPRLDRFNGVPSVEIQGEPAPGVSSGTAMDEVQKMVGQLGKAFSVNWSGISYEERQSGQQAPLLYAISIIVVFLSLAALYESWTVPIAVLMVAPLGVLGAVTFTWLGALSNDVYFKVALLTTVGLSAKNAILIVQYAKRIHEEGTDIMDAALAAMQIRFRPIVMTSMAFMLGVLPLALASGAGSASQNAIGYGVLGGMFTATYLATFFVPMFYVAVHRWFDRFKRRTVTA